MPYSAALDHLRAGRAQDAAALLESRVGRHPADAKAWFLLGACRHTLNDLSAAGEAFSRSLRLDPGNVDARFAHISVLRAQGDKHGALAASRKALAHLAGDVRASYAMALCLEDLSEYENALAHYDAVLARAPAHADALHNRGLLLARLGRLAEANENQRRYVAAHPREVRAHLALADICLALGRFEDAIAAIEAAERLAPGDVGVTLRRGAALASLRRFTEASESFAKALAVDSGAVAEFLQRIVPGCSADLMLSPENLFFWQCQLAFQRCDWTSWQACTEELRRLPSKPSALVEPAIAFLSFHLPVSGVERIAVARHIAAGIEARASVQLPPSFRPPGRIRVGVVSPDLREHLNGYLLLPLFQLLDRERFELYAYSLATDDASEIRAKLVASADHFRNLPPASDEESAAAIRADNIDILVDAAGHTTGGRFAITAQRPARLQVLYLGFAGSLGSRRVDYAIVDRVVAGKASEWSEALIHLPNTYYLYDFRSPAPEAQVSRSDYGLPGEAFVYCAFHKAEKISPDAFELWMKVLRQVPRSVLWLLALPDAAQRNLRRAAAAHGTDPARLHFAPFDPRERYLSRQRLGDLMLDTLHHSAMTTACDAMAAGLPVLTLPGSAMSSRAGESLVRAAGLPELVAPDKDSYVAQAVQLAGDPARLATYRDRLLGRTGPLFDTPGRVRELEQALLQMWRQYDQTHPGA